MHKLDPLPIHRKTLFAHSTLPLVFVMVLGVGAGQMHFALRQHQFKMVRWYCQGAQREEFHVNVPDDCWEISWDGLPPAVTSPWGESHVPKALHLYRGSSVVLYNPYEVGSASSEEFIELQLNRAIEKIHGVPVPSLPAASAAGPKEGLRDPAKRGELAVVWPEDRRSSLRSRTMAARAFLFGLFAAALISLGLQQFRATTPKHVYPWLLQGIALPVMVVVGGIYVADKTGYVSFHAMAAFPEVLTRKLAEAIPLSTPAIWGLAFVGLAAAYRVVRSRFEKIEAPLHHRKKLSEY
jgi:hypothetical protein